MYTVAEQRERMQPGLTLRDTLKPRGERMRMLRIEAGLSQDELADVAGSSQATISRVEKGLQNMSEPLKVKVADALGLTPEEFWPSITIEEVNKHRGWGDQGPVADTESWG